MANPYPVGGVIPYPVGGDMAIRQSPAVLQAMQARLDGFIAPAVWPWAAAGMVGVVIDCLPPGHPARRHVLCAWLALLLTTVILVPATLVALVGAPDPGVVLVVVSIGAYGVVGPHAHRCVTAIATDHRDAVATLAP